jgi:hypothetical protein
MIKKIRQFFCKHYFQMDKQILVIRCKKCKKEHWVEKNVNLF